MLTEAREIRVAIRLRELSHLADDAVVLGKADAMDLRRREVRCGEAADRGLVTALAFRPAFHGQRGTAVRRVTVRDERCGLFVGPSHLVCAGRGDACGQALRVL